MDREPVLILQQLNRGSQVTGNARPKPSLQSVGNLDVPSVA